MALIVKGVSRKNVPRLQDFFTLQYASDLLGNGFDVSFQPTLIAFIMFLIVLGTVMGGGPKILKSSFLNFISRLSYSLYLVHWPIYPSALILTSKIMGGDYSSLLFILVFSSLALALSFSAAIAVFFCVERPFLRIKDRI